MRSRRALADALGVMPSATTARAQPPSARFGSSSVPFCSILNAQVWPSASWATVRALFACADYFHTFVNLGKVGGHLCDGSASVWRGVGGVEEAGSACQKNDALL